VLQDPLLPGQGQQPLRVRALLHHDPAGAAGQQPRRLTVVAQAFHALGRNHDLDADVAQPLGEVDGRVDARGEGGELVQDQQGVFALAGLRPVA
jgi:hypothetical protein